MVGGPCHRHAIRSRTLHCAGNIDLPGHGNDNRYLGCGPLKIRLGNCDPDPGCSAACDLRTNGFRNHVFVRYHRLDYQHAGDWPG